MGCGGACVRAIETTVNELAWTLIDDDENQMRCDQHRAVALHGPNEAMNVIQPMNASKNYHVHCIINSAPCTLTAFPNYKVRLLIAQSGSRCRVALRLRLCLL